MKNIIILIFISIQSFAQTTVNGLVLEKRWTFPVVGSLSSNEYDYKKPNIGKVGNTLFIQSESFGHKYATNPDLYRDVVNLYSLKNGQFDTLYKNFPYIIFRNGYFRDFRSDSKWDGYGKILGKLNSKGDTINLFKDALNNKYTQILDFNDTIKLLATYAYIMKHIITITSENLPITDKRFFFQTESYMDDNIYSNNLGVWDEIYDFCFYKKDTIVVATAGDIVQYDLKTYSFNSRLYKIHINDTSTYYNLRKDTCYDGKLKSKCKFPRIIMDLPINSEIRNLVSYPSGDSLLALVEIEDSMTIFYKKIDTYLYKTKDLVHWTKVYVDTTIKLGNIRSIFIDTSKTGNKIYLAGFGELIMANEINNLEINPPITSTISLKNELLNISIYPNPSNGDFSINQKVEFLKIYNTFGQELKSFENTDRFNISQSGFYLVGFKFRDHISWTRIVVK